MTQANFSKSYQIITLDIITYIFVIKCIDEIL